MPQTMQFTKHGRTIEFDVPLYDEAHPTAREYAYFYGWRQSLQDAYATAKTADEMEGECQKKFDKIVSGGLKFRFDGQNVRKSELENEMDALALAKVYEIADEKNLKLTKARALGYAADLLARPAYNEEFREKAQENIERRRETAKTVNVDDNFFADLK